MSTSSMLDKVLKLRLAVARYGEMDRAGWWNTRGMMGRQGRVVIERGFPRTRALVQARIVFEVAKTRCAKVFSLPGAVTLWELPAELEDQFESRWPHWLEQGEEWKRFIENVDNAMEDNVLDGLSSLGLVEDIHLRHVTDAEVAGNKKAAWILDTEKVDDDTVASLAAGFATGDTNDLVVPYATLTA